MALKKLLEIKPRETSGSDTSSRYDYQRHWALCKLLELCSFPDFLLLLEYHDDVVIFDSSSSPKTANFFQIKTKKNGYWTPREIIEVKEGQKHSMIGKLYDHKIKFETVVSSLNLVSNVRFKFDLIDETKKSEDAEKICVIELEKKIVKKFTDAIKKEHSLSVEPVYEDMTFFLFSSLSLEDYVSNAKGKLVEFFERMLPGKKLPIADFYTTIADEIKRKSDRKGNFLDVEALKKSKAISKADFEGYLKTIAEQPDEQWLRVENRLNAEKSSIEVVMNWSKAWKAYQIAKSDKTNETLQIFRKDVFRFIENLRKNEKMKATLVENVEIIKTAFLSNCDRSSVPAVFINDYLEVSILEFIYA